MKESRLFKIVYMLLNKGQVTAKDLSEEFEVSIRTIYRDIDALSAAGIPIYTETGRNGGVSLVDDFTLDRTVFSEEEKKELLSSLQSLTVTGNISDQSSLSKLSALFNTKYDSWFEVDFSRFGHTTNDNEKFNLLKEAIINNISVDIKYINSYGTTSNRCINPLKFFYKSKEWYIKSYCNKSKDFRMFKFNRIIQASKTNQSFSPTTYTETDYSDNCEYTKFILHFSKEVAYRVYDEFTSDQIEVLDNGDLTVTTNMPEDSWVVGYLLSFSDSVEVIEPLRFKQFLKDESYKTYLKNK